jgi:2Fe-2S ferredoxin
MPKVEYVDSAGQSSVIDAAAGESVMETAVKNGIDGIVGECGGAASCCSCHVYVRSEFADRFAPVSDLEDDMLEGAVCERLPSSRLACQLVVSDDVDGLIVDLPAEQL